MVRTKADGGGRKAVAAKAPRKVLASSSGGASSSGLGSPVTVGKYAGGNPVVVRPTPDWQKGISSFWLTEPKKNKENADPEVADSQTTPEKQSSSSSSSTKAAASSKSSPSPAAAASSKSSPPPSAAEGSSHTDEGASPVKKSKLQKNNMIESDEED